ncbi:hypothetical protein GOP47_0002079 [Adiantum capillus-veneris]|uniref:Uncharacterized protein n=1 Tax=Adiantum capillus-veneris TaxID=13818 RepID=A0A9D4V9H0_ADICA|nr:hypothetical protein GOP47_0002079 [Adiantum capillus-veneris]
MIRSPNWQSWYSLWHHTKVGRACKQESAPSVNRKSLLASKSSRHTTWQEARVTLVRHGKLRHLDEEVSEGWKCGAMTECPAPAVIFDDCHV